MERKWMLGMLIGMLACVPASGDSAEHGGQEHGGQSTATPKEHQGSQAAAPISHGEGQPQGAVSKQPTMPASDAVKAEPSPEQIRQAIRDHIQKIEREQGAFTVQDEMTKGSRTLTLARVHDRVGKTGDLYYSCTDMKDINSGELLDLDFDVDAGSGTSEVIDVRIHKVNGNARYTYDEKDNRIPLM